MQGHIGINSRLAFSLQAANFKFCLLIGQPANGKQLKISRLHGCDLRIVTVLLYFESIDMSEIKNCKEQTVAFTS